MPLDGGTHGYKFDRPVPEVNSRVTVLVGILLIWEPFSASARASADQVRATVEKVVAILQDQSKGGNAYVFTSHERRRSHSNRRVPRHRRAGTRRYSHGVDSERRGLAKTS